LLPIACFSEFVILTVCFYSSAIRYLAIATVLTARLLFSALPSRSLMVWNSGPNCGAGCCGQTEQGFFTDGGVLYPGAVRTLSFPILFDARTFLCVAV